MKIQVQLHGILRDKLPPAAKGHTILDVPEATAVSRILDTLNLTRHIQVAINDKIVVDWQLRLHDGDEIDVFRPAAGG